MRQSQSYSATLQSYNTSLQADINQEKIKRQELERARDLLQAQVAELGGSLKSLEQRLEFEKVCSQLNSATCDVLRLCVAAVSL